MHQPFDHDLLFLYRNTSSTLALLSLGTIVRQREREREKLVLYMDGDGEQERGKDRGIVYVIRIVRCCCCYYIILSERKKKKESGCVCRLRSYSSVV